MTTLPEPLASEAVSGFSKKTVAPRSAICCRMAAAFRSFSSEITGPCCSAILRARALYQCIIYRASNRIGRAFGHIGPSDCTNSALSPCLWGQLACEPAVWGSYVMSNRIPGSWPCASSGVLALGCRDLQAHPNGVSTITIANC